MNPDSMLDSLTNIILTALDDITGNNLATLAHAIVNGTYTEAQLKQFTELVHDGFNGYAGCMVDVVRELADMNVPHSVINYAIRSYVRREDATR